MKKTTLLLLQASLIAGCASHHSTVPAAGLPATSASPGSPPTAAVVAVPTYASPGPRPVLAPAPVAEPLPVARAVLHFEPRHAHLGPRDRAALHDIARYLRQHRDARAQLIGYSDETEADGPRLSLHRARLAQAWLLAHGVRPAQLQASGAGKDKPLDSGHNAAAWARNRRVEVIYLSPAP